MLERISYVLLLFLNSCLGAYNLYIKPPYLPTQLTLDCRTVYVQDYGLVDAAPQPHGPELGADGHDEQKPGHCLVAEHTQVPALVTMVCSWPWSSGNRNNRVWYLRGCVFFQYFSPLVLNCSCLLVNVWIFVQCNSLPLGLGKCTFLSSRLYQFLKLGAKG